MSRSQWLRQSLLILLLLAASPVPAAAPIEQLTDDGLLKRDPCFQPDGSSILFASRHRSPRMVLMKLELAKNKVIRLNPASNLVELAPSFAGNGTLLCYQRMTGNDQTTFVIENKQAGSSRQLSASEAVSWNVRISPLGDAVTYNLSGQIYLRSLESDAEIQLTKSAGRNDWPAISPDGKQIAFSSSRDGDYELYLMGLDGSQPRRLTTASGLDMRPRWSPDGKQILFTSNRDGNYEIYLLDLESGKQQRLTRHQEQDNFACWHPDGKQLAWVRENQGRFDICRMPLANFAR